MNTPDPEFDRIVQHGYDPHLAYDPNPYGPPAHTATPAHAGVNSQVKPGMTKRGKTALTAVGVVLVGGVFLGYQSHTATVAADQAHAKELELQAQLLRIEELKEINRANENAKKTAKADEKTRQVSVDSCIDQEKNLVGKGMGSPSYREVIDNCLTRYGAQNTTGTARFDNAAASNPLTSTTAAGAGEEGLNGFVVLGVGALAVLAFGAAKRGTRPTSA
ncbi:hypothetical protein ACFQ8W_01700 [Streptomyces sp. NPDC056508]|uniref:hypothetical protein n=1 Tax=Streptomyces sp. NPDC056508 TaxID=3345845 RepID=UPI00369A6BBD